MTTTEQFIEALNKGKLSENQWRTLRVIYNQPAHKCSPVKLVELLGYNDLVAANSAFGVTARTIGEYLGKVPDEGNGWSIAYWNSDSKEWVLLDSFVEALEIVGIGQESASNWTREELKASVEAYLDMKRKMQAGDEVNKKQCYRDLSKRFGRSEKAYEYRMQNISYVLSLVGREWVTGLLPASNVGANVAAQIEDILAEVENRTVHPRVQFEAKVQVSRKRSNLQKPAGVNEPKSLVSLSTHYDRDPEVKAWVLKESKGKCECCGNPAPFLTGEGTPFLEVHHVRHLAEKGPDIVENAVALCPNCHREIHHGVNSKTMVDQLYSNITRLVRRNVFINQVEAIKIA